MDYIKLGFIPFEEVLDKAKEGVDSLLLLSGGLDSAYCLFKYAEVCGDRVIQGHHIKMYPSIRQRYQLEEFSLDRQITYLDKKVKLVKSTVEISEDFNILPMRDFFLAVVMSIKYAERNDLRYLVVGDDIIDGFLRGSPIGHLPNEDYERELEGLKVFIDSMSKGKVELSLSMRDNDVYSKYMELPDDYLKLCFSCRNPRIRGDYAQPCSECQACCRNRMLGIDKKLAKHVRFKN